MMEYVTVGHVAWNTDVGWNMLVEMVRMVGV